MNEYEKNESFLGSVFISTLCLCVKAAADFVHRVMFN